MPASMELLESAVLAFFGAMTLLASIPFSVMFAVFSLFRGLFAKGIQRPKTILITGASSGIGSHLAMQYSQHGNQVIIFGRNEAHLRRVEKDCSDRGAMVRAVKIDVTERDEMNKVLRELDDEFGGLDLVICNAGVTADAHAKSVHKLGIDGVAKLMVETNVLGVFNTLAPIIQVMQKRGKGHIVITGSIVGLFGNPNFAIYCATKAMMQSLARDLYFSLQKKNINLSLIAPGFVETPMTDIIHHNFESWFPKILYWSPERSARFIKSRIAAGSYYIAFPKYFELGVYMASVLPPSLQTYASAASGYSGMMGKPAPDVLCVS